MQKKVSHLTVFMHDHPNLPTFSEWQVSLTCNEKKYSPALWSHTWRQPVHHMASAVEVEVGSIPVGVFWDIENCCIPKFKSALFLVQVIRERFLCNGFREAEFMCACDTSNENKKVIQELNQAQVCTDLSFVSWITSNLRLQIVSISPVLWSAVPNYSS